MLLLLPEKQTKDIIPIPRWNVESLNEDFYVQFPDNYTGFGYDGSCFEKLNPSKDIIINQCFCYDPMAFFCVGDSLTDPLPDTIIKLPYAFSCSFMIMGSKEALYDSDSILSGFFYFSETGLLEIQEIYIREARFYKKINSYYISKLQVKYNTEKVDTVRMICNSIMKK